MKKLTIFLLGLLFFTGITLVVIIIQKLNTHIPALPIVVPDSDRNAPSNLLDKEQNRNYVTVISETPKTLQIQGVINGIFRDGFSIWSQKTYTIVATKKSVIECRDKFIKLPDGTLALAYTAYLDLSRYAASLETNKDTFLKQGKLFPYIDAYRRIEPDSWVTGVFEEQAGKDKKYMLDVLLVYGCK